MSDNDTDTGTGQAGTDANAGAAGAAAAGASAQGGQDQVSLLTSRLNGQTAKVGELTTQKTALESERDALKQRIADLEGGKVSAEEAANARVTAIQSELEQERAARKTEALKARFPETFSVFGDTASTFTEETLAASEARLVNGGAAAEPPTPETHNESRSGTTGAAKPAKAPTSAELRAKLEGMPLPDGWS
jgi:hypothetical protein